MPSPGRISPERQFAQTVADNRWRINRSRSIEHGMLALGHSEAAGDFEAEHPEIQAVMPAAKAFRDHSQAFVNLSICEQRLHRAMKDALRQLKELQSERRSALPDLKMASFCKIRLYTSRNWVRFAKPAMYRLAVLPPAPFLNPKMASICSNTAVPLPPAMEICRLK
jgi:hypothetical protein